MKEGFHQEIIAAPATPPGTGGVAIIRLSGSGCNKLIKPLFRPASSFAGFRPYRLHHGWFLDKQGGELDEVLISFMPGPGSYTGEDTVEINCHGGPAIVRCILETLYSCGIRPAGPGEFTFRAFVNGKLGLDQAEAVAEMISAPSRRAADFAREKMKGRLGKIISRLRQGLEELRVQLLVAVDFPEDELECLSREEFSSKLIEAERTILQLVENFERTSSWREG
ncbi:MAG: tRNA uridine-5-carboxymethylaminomethyl(34) synthesis GTPase MnmE, partial [Desulfovibrionales bacterium]